jgi:hypothetical protein
MSKNITYILYTKTCEGDEKKKKRTGCGATNACVSLKKESGVIRSDIFSRSLPLLPLLSLVRA